MRNRPSPSRFHDLPVRLTRVIGREPIIGQLEQALDNWRLVTIAGPGGIGKSTVAFAVAELKSARTGRGACFVDLSLSFDRPSVDAQIAAAIGLDGEVETSRQALVEHLQDSDVLIVFDNCEHVIGDIAELAQSLGQSAPGVGMLATSREPLGVPGERVHRLSSLGVPPREEALSIAEVLEFPAAELFSERAASTGYILSDGDVDAVIDICHRLDGIPLALELAASRIGLLGAKELNARLDDRFELLVGARRTAVPRHQTLLATLDWSYSTLTRDEQRVFVSLGAFRNSFELPHALALLAFLGLSEEGCIQLLASLVGKSLVTTLPGRKSTTYRLLESARQYALEKLDQSSLGRQARLAHVEVCVALVAGAKQDLLVLDRALWMKRYGSVLVDLMAALQWTGGNDGDRTAGVRLATAAAPLTEQLFLAPAAFQQAVNLSPDTGEDALRLTLPLIHMQGHVDGHVGQMATSADQAVRRQEELGIVLPEVIAAQFGVALIRGNYRKALELAGTIERLGKERNEPELSTLGTRVAAQALFYLGRIEEAQRNALAVIASPYEFLPHTVNNHKVSMRVILALCAAFNNRFDEALGWVDEAVTLGRGDTPITRCLSLAIGGIPVAVWANDEKLARSLLNEATGLSEKHSLKFWRLVAEDLSRALDHVWGMQSAGGVLHDQEEAIGITSIDTLPTFAPTLLTPRALERVELGEVGWNAAEILRCHAVQIRGHSPQRASEVLHRAASIASEQGARFWEKRIVLTREQFFRGPTTTHYDAAS